MKQQVKQVPYGVSDFATVMSQNLYYVDKTMFFLFNRFFCKDTLNIRNCQTFLVIFVIYSQMIRVCQ